MIIDMKIDLEAEVDQMTSAANTILTNKNYTHTEETRKQKRTYVNHDVTQCNACYETCHERCVEGEDKTRCTVMRFGRCTKCKGRCPARNHVNSNVVIS